MGGRGVRLAEQPGLSLIDAGSVSLCICLMIIAFFRELLEPLALGYPILVRGKNWSIMIMPPEGSSCCHFIGWSRSRAQGAKK